MLNYTSGLQPRQVEIGNDMLGSRRLAAVSAIIIVLAATIWGAYQQKTHYLNAPMQREEFLLDTLVTVKAYGRDRSAVEKGVFEAFAAMREIDDLSDYFDPSSEISSINKKAGVGSTHVSEELYEIILLSAEYARLTGGAYDPTVGAVTKLYDFEKEIKPSADELAAALKLVGADGVMLNPATRSVKLKKRGMRLDLGGVAKGYAADKAAATLRQHGISQALVTTGSTTIVIGGKPRAGYIDTLTRSAKSFFGSSSGGPTNPWRVGIQHPRKPPGQTSGALTIRDRQISTSGDYQQYFTDGETRYHHILDPKTGRPASGIASLTVITTRSCAEADVISTALFVMGPEGALEYVEQQKGLEAVIITTDGTATVSSGLKKEVEIESKLDFEGL